MKTQPSLRNSLKTLATVLGLFLLAPADPAGAAGPTVTILGTNAGPSITGTDDTAIGNSALQLDTSGSFNTAVGSLTLSKNVAGAYNTAIGFGALKLSLANYNTALGSLALTSNTNGERNLALGYATLYKNTTGSLNTGVGFGALFGNLTGTSNVAFGYQALYNNATGSFNVALGDGALFNAAGSGNIGIGDDGGYNLTTGSNNIYIGNPGGVPGGGAATESGIIRIGYTKNGAVGMHTDTYLAGVLHGNGAALTNLPTTALTGTIGSAQIAAGAVSLGKIGAGAVTVQNLASVAAPASGQVLSFNGSNLTWTSPAGVFSLNGTSAFYNGGNVGIGTNAPVHKLAVIGGPYWTSSYWTGSLELANASAIAWQPNDAGYSYGIGHTNGSIGFFRTAAGPGTGVPTDFNPTGTPAEYQMVITDAGNVGIGTIAPTEKLTVFASGYGFQQTDGTVTLAAYTAASQNAGFIGTRSNHQFHLEVNGSPRLTIDTAGNVGIGTTTPAAKLDVSGGIAVNNLTIRGGADVAEPFPMEDALVEKGSVVVIDEAHPGRLKRSTRAYDRRVAGIVSGANGINAGIALQQEGALEGGQNVALSGRVYVQADTSGGAIRPGDLLTTSDAPGHAMKVTDYTKAQGAVIGKAMSALDEGSGMVLVLVTLQ